MQQTSSDAPQMNGNELYLEENFTDRKVGVIKRLTPVDGNGNADPARDTIYQGETQIMLGNSPLPISFEISADSLADAASQFSTEAQKAAEDTIKQLEEMRRDMQNQIVVPGQGGMPPGGVGGPGGIQMP
jgi:hypothetical protein